MPFAVELYFEPATDARIRALWDAIAAPDTSQMTLSGARPHVSLVVCNSAPLPETQQCLAEFAASTPAFSMTLSSLGLFATPSPVAFLAPKITPELLALHERFFNSFTKLTADCWPHYCPAQWVPHCTLAAGLPPQQLSTTLVACQSANLPIQSTVREIGLVAVGPVVREVFVVGLA